HRGRHHAAGGHGAPRRHAAHRDRGHPQERPPRGARRRHAGAPGRHHRRVGDRPGVPPRHAEDRGLGTMARPVRTLAALSALYFTQGLPFGFQALALPVYLRQSGVALTTIGFLSALAAPWIIKPVWGPLVDRYGTRRRWIVPLQGGLALTCAAAALSPPTSHAGMVGLLALVFLMNLFAATQDVAVDGLAVDLLRPEDLGAGNTAQVVGYKVGMLTGGGVLVGLSADIGWRGLFLIMAGLTALALAVTLTVREAPRRPVERETFGDIFRTLSAALVRRENVVLV